MTFTFRMRFSGLCVFVPDKPFGPVEPAEPDRDRYPGRVRVLLPNLLQPEQLKATGSPAALSDPHFPLLEFDRRNRQGASTRDEDFVSRSSIYDGRSCCLLFGEDLEIRPDDRPPSPDGGVTTPPFVPGGEKDSLAWMVQVGDVSPPQGTIAPALYDAPPDTPAAGSGYGSPSPSTPPSIIARVLLVEGRLTTSQLSDSECDIIPPTGSGGSFKKRRIAVELMLEIPGVEREVVITMARRNGGVPQGTRRLVLAPATADPGDSVVEVRVHNREIDGFVGIPLDYAESKPMADFEIYYKLSSSQPAGGTPSTILPTQPARSPTAGTLPNGKCPPTAMARP